MYLYNMYEAVIKGVFEGDEWGIRFPLIARIFSL